MKKKLLTILIAALSVRFFALILLPERSVDQDDSAQWNNTALHFLQGKGFLSETENLDPKRPPVYPLFIAAQYFLFGENNFLSVKIAQVLLSGLSCLILGAIASSLVGPSAGFWIGLLSAFYPPLILYSGIFQSETLFTFLLLLFLWIWIRAPQGGTLVSSAAGLTLGFLTLCRGTMLFFLPFLVIVPILQKGEKRLRKTVLVLAMVFLMVAPWTWRNYKVYGVFIPVITGGSELFWFGTLPLDSQKKYGESQEWKNLKVPSDIREGERFYWKQAFRNIRANPGRYCSLTVKKFFYFWFKPIGHEMVSRKSVPLGWILLLAHFSLILLFLHGIMLTRFAWTQFLPVYSLMMYFALFHTLLMPMPRFRLPIEPLFLLFATVSILRFFEDKESHV
ncbi:MAG: glycosyltransferase family 39 protein [Elusimicrobia bacterium]|nr:glycosyltransferase family 39 protein [Elusimicrobiota bacterium]